MTSEKPQLSTAEDIAGDVSEGSSTLDGMELDEDSVKAQQMVEQVSTMVKENPDGAANLVKRWLNRN
jgi:flagellar biosynthesis/type III secretory pathway M-ring protein FliF/YscJ